MHLCYILTFLSILKSSIADIYMHNPRGSNNRLNEANRERNNANRMFDSQNNNRGGYNVGGLYYMAASRLQIEWTNQHGCANKNTECDIILQYMCSDSLRDGSITTSIPESSLNCENNNCTSDRKYGMHEDYDYFKRCSTRQRNNGLFVADQILKGKTARFTRQNPNGQRSGYECSEERDYYPYWGSSPWIDIAILTSRVDRCSYYQKNSQNVLSRWECRLPTTAVVERVPSSTPVPIDRVSCEAFRVAPLLGSNDSAVYGRWTEIAAHGVAVPECREPEWTRDNHLGNTFGGEMPTYNWTLPASFTHESCSLRLRYNISSTDYTSWNSNENRSLVPSDLRAASTELAQRHGFNDSLAAALRGYQWKGNPVVKPFPGIDLSLQLAVNTAQIGRVFQDRSHAFAIRDRPVEIDTFQSIHQLNVRGKRGNIVQVFPAVEYDFVPNTLQMTNGDYLHVQWTGSNSNDQQLDGQGLAGTDRSNLLLLANRAYWDPAAEGRRSEIGDWARAYPFQYSLAGFNDNNTLLQLPIFDLSRLALSSAHVGAFLGDMSELDDSATYFDLGARKITQTGVFHTMCSRNNNFSNRSHKGRIICGFIRSEIFALGANGGEARLQDGSFILSVAPGTFSSLQKIKISHTPLFEAKKLLLLRNSDIVGGREYASDFYTLEFSKQDYSHTVSMNVTLKLNSAATDGSSIILYRADASTFSNWERVFVDDSQQSALGYLSFHTVLEGVYVARYPSNSLGWIVGLVVGLLVLLALMLTVAIYIRRNPSALDTFSSRLRYLKRSTASKV